MESENIAGFSLSPFSFSMQKLGWGGWSGGSGIKSYSYQTKLQERLWLDLGFDNTIFQTYNSTADRVYNSLEVD